MRKNNVNHNCAGGSITFVRRRPFYIHFDWRECVVWSRGGPHQISTSVGSKLTLVGPPSTVDFLQRLHPMSPTILSPFPVHVHIRNTTYKSYVHTLYVAFNHCTHRYICTLRYTLCEYKNSLSSSGFRTGKYYIENISSSK